MIRILTLITALICSFEVGQCQTYVSGGIFTNTTWTPVGNPYIVTGSIVVMTGTTLTIQPGVIVKFDNGTKMEVRGFLTAIGNSSDSILFTSSSSAPFPGIWVGIEFWNSYTIEYVKITYAAMGIKNTNQPDIHINHCFIAYNDTGIYNFGYNNTETIANTIFEGNGSAITDASEADYISNCIFINNNIGIGYVFSTEITGCSFFGHTNKAIDGFGSNYIGNIFQNNNIGLRIKVYNSQYQITNNTIINNQIGIQIRGDATSTPNTNFFNNTICNNIIHNAEISGNVSVYLPNNCWCTTDSIAIANSIYDAYDNLALGLIFYSPFQTNCTSSVLDPEAPAHVKFYPNPLRLNDKLKSDINLTDATIEVYNSLGDLVQQVENINGQFITVDRDKINTGIYFIRVTQNNKQISIFKVLIE